MNAARWVLVGILAGGSVAFFGGCALGLLVRRRNPCAECIRWQALVDEIETELRDAQAELAKVDATIADLHRNMGVVWDAGVYAGQTFQADRQDNGL